MKNIFKFAAMAFAAVVMFASCDSKDDDAPKATIEKQWEAEFGYAWDFGTTTKNQVYYTMPSMGEENAETGKIDLMAMPVGTILEIVETDATSGVIKVEADAFDEEYNPIKVQGEIPYKDLTINSVSVDMGITSGCQPTGEWLELKAMDASKYNWVPMQMEM